MGNWMRETVDLVRHRRIGKRELLRLPKDELASAFNDGWLDRFWALPQSELSTAVDIRLEGRRLRERREDRSADLDAQTRSHRDRERRFWSRNGFRSDPPEESQTTPPEGKREPEPPTAEELEELRRIAERLRSEEPQKPIRLTGKFAEAQRRIEQAESLIKGAQRHVGAPWDAWIASLPVEAREDGILACLLWRDMIHLRDRLHEAVRERRILAGILEDEAQRVLDVRMFELRGKIKTCEHGFATFAPFFERYGKPPLVDVQPATKDRKQEGASPPKS